ncbi:MAG: trigger factor [Dehalococcoidia bacterium]
MAVCPGWRAVAGVAELKVSTERIPESQVVMTIEVESERLDEARGKALRRLSPKARVPGFRAGKAPPDMVRRHLGEERILDEALDVLVPDVYREAVEADESIVPIARPRLVIETTEPLVVKATIPVRPTIELGDYRSVRVAPEPITVEEARVDETVLALRRRNATLEPVEREIRWRDVVRFDVKGIVEGESLVSEDDAEVQLIEERDVLFEGFEEGLLGHRKGETVEFDLPVPERVRGEAFAGKACHFTVAIKETKEEVLPALDDEFAKQLGDGFETVEALHERIRDDIRKHEEEQRDNRWHDQILGELLDRATVEYPPVMLEAEIDRILHEQLGQIQHGRDLDRYLAGIGKTEAEVHEEIRPVADLRLRRSLILGKVAEAETIEVGNADVEEEIERLTAAAGPQQAQLRQLFTSEDGRATIRRNLQTRKTLARLVELATQDGGATATAEKEPPAKKPRGRKKKAGEEAASAADAGDAERQGA